MKCLLELKTLLCFVAAAERRVTACTQMTILGFSSEPVYTVVAVRQVTLYASGDFQVMIS